MSSEGLPVNNVVGTSVELAPRSTADAASAASSSQAADSAAASADRAWKFSNDSAASAAAAKTSENNAAASANDTVKKSVTILQAMSGALTVTDAVSVSAKSDVSNANLFFTNSDKAETNAIFSSAAGQMSIRVGKGGYSNVFDPNGFFEPSAGIRLSSRTFSYTDIQGSTGSTPFSVNGYVLRGKDLAGFSDLNNINLCSWNGVGFVPVTTASLGPGVEQGKPSVYIDTRSGKVNSIGGFYTNSVAMLKAGDYGLGTSYPIPSTDPDADRTNQFFRWGVGVSGTPGATQSWAGVQGGYDTNARWQLAWSQGSTGFDLATRVRATAGAWSPVWAKIWHTTNTTVDANGFIKKASPIVKLFADGSSELNGESQGVTTERLSEGVYRISGVFGFNGDGAWGGPGNGIEIPVDDNKRPLIWVESKVLPDGDIEIRTYHRTYDTGPYSARNIEAMDSGEVGKKKQPIFVEMPDGTPIDIPVGRWIDLRVEMPASDEPEYEPALEEETPEPAQPVVTEPAPEITNPEAEQGQEPEQTKMIGSEQGEDSNREQNDGSKE